MTSTPLTVLIHEGFAELSSSLGNLDTLHITNTEGQSDSVIAGLLANAQVLVSSEFKAAWRGDQAASSLRLVQSTGAGIDGIHSASLPPGCVVCNVYGHERGVAEHAFMLILALQRSLFKLDAALRHGDWSPHRGLLPELRGRNLLILGLGHIGAELARWGRFLGMKVTGLTRSPCQERGDRLGLHAIGGFRELGDHLGKADFVVVAIPAAPETADLIGEQEFQQMKPSAFLVNVGRAVVVNEDAFYQALCTRRIAGAAFDVWYQYPGSGSERRLPSRLNFHELDNIIMTPHKPTVETMEYRWQMIAENIQRFARGEPPRCVACTV